MVLCKQLLEWWRFDNKVKSKPFHARSASLCSVSWFWDVQNMNNSWSAFQCTCAAWWEKIVESRLRLIDLRVQPRKWIWARALSPGVVSEHAVADAGLLPRLTRKAWNTSTTGQFSLLGIAGARPVFSKRMNQKSYRLQCAILATVFETWWVEG